MRKKRDDENGDFIDQFGSYTGPAIVAIVALVAGIVVILVSSSSPRVGIATVGVMLLANRAFVVRTLAKLGLNFEPVRSSLGRPSGQNTGWQPP